MKAKLFFLFPFLLLILGGSICYGNTIQKNDFKNNFHFFSENNNTQLSNIDKIIVLIEENDVDNDEELNSDDNQTTKIDSFKVQKNYLITVNKNLIRLFDLNFYNNQFVTLPKINANSNPLYLQQSVFRI